MCLYIYREREGEKKLFSTWKGRFQAWFLEVVSFSKIFLGIPKAVPDVFFRLHLFCLLRPHWGIRNPTSDADAKRRF